ncbi:MAG: hypothetical protein ACI8XC_004193 [Gammaproteobacteria bacterium]|jgi:hypothetical protein
MPMCPSDNNDQDVSGPDQDTTPVFSWNHIKIPATLAVSCLAFFVLLSISKFILSIEPSASPHHERPFRLIPIFLALNSGDGQVTYVNESDLGVKVKNLSETLVELPWTVPEIEPNVSGVVTLHQPDEFKPREVLLKNLNLSPVVVEQAITTGKDFTRLKQQHKKEILELPNGEKAIWIQVHQISRMSRYWNGLLYVIRNGLPVLLMKTNAKIGFAIKDIDGDDFKDVIRITANNVTTVHWEYFKWAPEVDSFRRQYQGSDRFVYQFVLEDSKIFLSAVAPFIFVFLLGMKFNIGWMRWIVRLYFSLNLFFILCFTLLSIINVVLAGLIVLFQYCCSWMTFKRFKRKKSSPTKTVESS